MAVTAKNSTGSKAWEVNKYLLGYIISKLIFKVNNKIEYLCHMKKN